MTRPAQRTYRPPTTSRVLAATLGTLPASFLIAAAVGRFLPAASPVSFAAAYLLWLPIWLGLACWIACRAPGLRAWLTCLALTVVAAAIVLGVPHP